MLANKVVPNVNMLGMRGNGVHFCDHLSTLIVTENGKRFCEGNFCKGKEKTNPNSLLNGVSQSIVFRLCVTIFLILLCLPMTFHYF